MGQQIERDPVETNPEKPKGLAVAGMVTSIIGFILSAMFIGLVLSIVGIVLSAVALHDIKKGIRSGRGMAIAGVIIGGVGVVSWIVTLIVHITVVAPKEEQLRQQLQRMR